MTYWNRECGVPPMSRHTAWVAVPVTAWLLLSAAVLMLPVLVLTLPFWLIPERKSVDTQRKSG